MHIITFLGNINHTADINLHLYTYHYNAMQFTNIQKSTYKHYTYSVCDVRAAQPSIFALLMCTFTHIYNTEEIVKTTRYFSNVKQFLDRVLFYLNLFLVRTPERVNAHIFSHSMLKKRTKIHHKLDLFWRCQPKGRSIHNKSSTTPPIYM